MRLVLTSSLLAAAVLVSCSHAEGPPPATASAAKVVASKDPVADFAIVVSVLQDPRCQNCHPAIESVPHTMNVQRGPDGRGLAGAHCRTCHGKANPPDSYGAHQPPGVATDWRLPPSDTKMVFVGRSAKDLCEQIKDPDRNGGKDMTALVHHVSSDPLVLWGWAPGYGRKPVAVPHADFVAAFTRWANAGGPCPGVAPKTASRLDGPK
jgi:hypothetical protein